MGVVSSLNRSTRTTGPTASSPAPSRGSSRSGRPAGRFDPDELAAAFNDRTKAIILCNPNNPTGTVFTRDDLEAVAALCRKWDVIAITDEIYEHIIYDGRPHVALAGARRDARALGDDRRDVEDLRRDRLAGRHDDRPAAR